MSSCRRLGIPYYFDPGQAVRTFTAHELKQALHYSVGVFLNEVELTSLCELTGLSLKKIQNIVDLCVVTHSAKGSTIYYKGSKIAIAPVKAKKILDPTGCGDAYRAGFYSVLAQHKLQITPDILQEAGAAGSRQATKCIMKLGPH